MTDKMKAYFLDYYRLGEALSLEVRTYIKDNAKKYNKWAMKRSKTIKVG